MATTEDLQPAEGIRAPPEEDGLQAVTQTPQPFSGPVLPSSWGAPPLGLGAPVEPVQEPDNNHLDGGVDPAVSKALSQLSAALWHPPTPEKEVEVEEELCVEKVVGQLPEATPFFDHGTKILVKGGQVGSSMLSVRNHSQLLTHAT